MARRKESLLDVLMDIASKLPWQAGLAVALVAYLVFHHFASLSPFIPTSPGSNFDLRLTWNRAFGSAFTSRTVYYDSGKDNVLRSCSLLQGYSQ